MVHGSCGSWVNCVMGHMGHGSRKMTHFHLWTGCEVIAFFVYPRWLSAAILDFIEPQIAPFDPTTPKTLAWNQTLGGSESDAPFARYSPIAFKLYTVTLKLGFGVTQGHRKWHYSIVHIRLCIRLLVICLYILPFPRYSRILVQNRYTPLVFGTPVIGMKPSDLRNDPWWWKTRLMGLSDRERISWYVHPFSYKARMWQTDGQTEELPWHRPPIYTRYSIYAVARKNWSD